MELRDLRTLVTVVRSGSFTVAAAELGYTQSAVSQQIRALEQEVGRPLLERRPVRPTPAGARLIEHANRILMRVDVACSELSNIDRGGPKLRVAACPLAATTLLAAGLRMVRKGSPSVRISLRSTTPGDAMAALAAGEMDVALVDGLTAPDNPLAPSEPGFDKHRIGRSEGPGSPTGRPPDGRSRVDRLGHARRCAMGGQYTFASTRRQGRRPLRRPRTYRLDDLAEPGGSRSRKSAGARVGAATAAGGDRRAIASSSAGTPD